MTTEKMIVSYHRVSPTKHDRVSVNGEKASKEEITEKLHKSLISSKEVCRNAAKLNGETIDKEYVDEYRSGKNQEHMLSFQEMMRDAKAGKIKKVYIRRVNRFGRNMMQSAKSMIELDALDVNVISVENGLDTSKPFGKSIIFLLLEMAEMDRDAIEEATTIGREKALADGVKFGQPKKDINVKMLRSERLKPPAERSTWEQLEKDFKCSRTTLINNLKKAGYWDNEKRCAK